MTDEERLWQEHQLISSVLTDNLQWFQKLILIGEDINKKDGDGMTALHHSAFHFKETFTMILLKQGAIKELKDGNGMTPLHCAVLKVVPNAKTAQQKTVQRLVAFGAPANA
jgi:ankyrin repeat protein